MIQKQAKKTTIVISKSAWPTHQAHGDTQGACSSNSKTGKVNKPVKLNQTKPASKP